MVEDSYRRVAGFYDRLFEPMNKGLRLLGLRMYRPTAEMKVLDVGCGTGVHLSIYRRFKCQLSGIDSSSAMLDIARERLGDEADLRLGSATEMPFDNDSFDLIICMLVLHEMDQEARQRTLAEMKRVLKPGGRILLIDFHAGSPAFPDGWWPKLIIFLSEVAAGRRHFRNYRHFMSISGLPALIKQNRLETEEQKVVGGRTMTLHLVRDPRIA